jgi:Lipopolysaccharide-assembly
MGRAILLLAVALLSGCLGYTLGPIPPTFMKGAHKVAVPIFDNKTYEPQIQTLVTDTFIKQLQQDGTYEIVGEDQADAVVRGTISGVTRVKARSVIGNVLASAQVRLIVKLHLQVVNPHSGAPLYPARDFLGQTTYFVGNDLPTQERQAIPLAAEDAAEQAASFLTEGW